ncbi:MAG: hypothetical protein QNK37_01440 [Acidobacteriota bacterium]|nr:hypothetical protein [Acidobacteriota bacterium]
MIFLLIIFGMIDPKPINLSLGSAVIELDLETMSGTKLKLDNVADNTFCFFLSTNCPACVEAIKIIESRFMSKHHCIFLILGEKDKIDQYFTNYPKILQDQIFFITQPTQLDEYNIVTLPALLAYKNSKLQLSYHGPLKDRACNILLHAYNKKIKKGTQ